MSRVLRGLGWTLGGAAAGVAVSLGGLFLLVKLLNGEALAWMLFPLPSIGGGLGAYWGTRDDGYSPLVRALASAGGVASGFLLALAVVAVFLLGRLS